MSSMCRSVQQQRCRNRSRPRRGLALFIALAFIALLMALLIQAGRLVSVNRSAAERDARDSQARAMLDLGVILLESKLRNEPQFQGHEFEMNLEHDGYAIATEKAPCVARVSIESVPSTPHQWRVTATLYPDEPRRAIVASRDCTMSKSADANTSSTVNQE